MPSPSGRPRCTLRRSMAALAAERGWQVAVINMRACGSSPVTSPRLFSAHRGANDDVRTAVEHLRRTRLGGRPDGRLAAIGWSNSGTILNNVLAEQATSHRDAGRRFITSGGSRRCVRCAPPTRRSGPQRSSCGSPTRACRASWRAGAPSLRPPRQTPRRQWGHPLQRLPPAASHQRARGAWRWQTCCMPSRACRTRSSRRRSRCSTSTRPNLCPSSVPREASRDAPLALREPATLPMRVVYSNCAVREVRQQSEAPPYGRNTIGLRGGARMGGLEFEHE